MFGHLKDMMTSHDKILKLLKEHENSEDNKEGFFYYNEQNFKDILRRFEDELKHVVETVHERWKENISAGKDAPETMDRSLTVGKPLPKSAKQVSN